MYICLYITHVCIYTYMCIYIYIYIYIFIHIGVADGVHLLHGRHRRPEAVGRALRGPLQEPGRTPALEAGHNILYYDIA